MELSRTGLAPHPIVVRRNQSQALYRLARVHPKERVERRAERVEEHSPRCWRDPLKPNRLAAWVASMIGLTGFLGRVDVGAVSPTALATNRHRLAKAVVYWR